MPACKDAAVKSSSSIGGGRGGAEQGAAAPAQNGVEVEEELQQERDPRDGLFIAQQMQQLRAEQLPVRPDVQLSPLSEEVRCGI